MRETFFLMGFGPSPRLPRRRWQGILTRQEQWRWILQRLAHHRLPLHQWLAVLVAHIPGEFASKPRDLQFKPRAVSIRGYAAYDMLHN